MASFSVVWSLVVVSLAVLTSAQQEGVAVKWGVADGTATVGRMFRMHIPSDAFSGDVTSYTIKSVDGSALPAWLEFDPSNNILQGIPAPKDAGQLYLEITAQGSASQASVTFTLFVRDVPTHTSGTPLRFKTTGPEFVHCKQSEPETVATIIIDVDFDKIPVQERLALLQRFLAHMQLHEDMVKMVPVGNSPMHDSSALVSGVGDCAEPKTQGLFISWPVGCGLVKDGHFPVLQKLDEDSTSGLMAQALGNPVIGWHVTNSHIQAPTRKRRQALNTPTPSVTPIMSTKTQTTGAQTGVGDTLTHMVVVMESPVIIQPTSTYAPMDKTDLPTLAPPQPPPKPKDVTQTMLMPTQTTITTQPPMKTTKLPIKPTKTSTTGKPTDKVVVTPPPPPDCQRLKTKGSLTVEAILGDYKEYEIPEDTFKDCEVAETQSLRLKLFNNTSEIISSSSFLMFDEKNQKIKMFPFPGEVPNHKLKLIGEKSINGETLSESVDVKINLKGHKKKDTPNHEFGITVDYNYNTFMSNFSDKFELATRIAKVFGDTNLSNINVVSIKNGSVIFTWANKTLAYQPCQADKLKDLLKNVVDDQKITAHAVETLRPYALKQLTFEPKKTCSAKMDKVVAEPEEPIAPVDPSMKPDDDEQDPGMDDSKSTTAKTSDKPDDTTDAVAKGSAGGDDDVWITTVVPAVVIVAILLIALLIACCLYRKKRKGKMNVEEQNTFINKGAPVIFPDELEDKPSDVNKPLLVEGSPAPPPEYHRGPSESPERYNNQRNIYVTDSAQNGDGITEMPYEPPHPPVQTSTNSKQPRPTHQQFTQPPQILP
ncbi:dystroglycan 1-like [Physella acuta]|uniref:dystroglycan 1-like n=1 Tax=Physella acuta TaxID=109671 RepID=UPI0027DB11C0|nr:dystroglycan 1-like [Physella acuta]